MTCSLRHVTIVNRVTGASFPHPSYTKSIEESIALASLTFSASLWNITGNSPTVPSPMQLPPRPAHFQTTATKQTELF